MPSLFKEEKMGKKGFGILENLYLCGCALIAIGFCLPVFSALKRGVNGFALVSKDFSVVSLGVLLIFIGAVAGIVLCFIGIKNAKLLKLAAIALSILGGIILVVRMNDNAISRLVGKGFLKNTAIGFWLIIVGWITAAVGYFKTR